MPLANEFRRAYLPTRQRSIEARRAILDLVATNDDPALQQAIEFSRQALAIEVRLVDRDVALGAQLGPGGPIGDAHAAGVLCQRVKIGINVAAHLAYLRCSLPADPGLEIAARVNAGELRAVATQLTVLLRRSPLALIAKQAPDIEDAIARTTLEGATADRVKDLHRLEKLVDSQIASIAEDYGVAAPAEVAVDPAAYRAVLANPQADAPRLAYAALGDPRAEVIRAQFEARVLRRAGKLPEAAGPDGRARQLIAAQPAWTVPLEALGARAVSFDRGFPSGITIDAATWLARGRELYETAPITQLTLGEVTREALASPLLAQIDSLAIVGQRLADDDAIALANNPAASKLRVLDLRDNAIDERGVEAIATKLRALEHVELRGNPYDPVDVLDDVSETRREYVSTALGRALEAKLGPLPWLHPQDAT